MQIDFEELMVEVMEMIMVFASKMVEIFIELDWNY